MSFKIYFKNNCFVTVSCDVVTICPQGECDNSFDILCCRNHYVSVNRDYNDVCIAEFDFSDIVRVVEICSDSIEPYEKDVTEELRLRCKSSRGGVSGDIVRPPFGNIVFDFEDYILRFLTIGANIAIAISIMLVLKHFLKLF